jgi:quinol monooxygenase YgiN
MSYILTTRCRVQPGKMESFLRDVQQWEEAAMAATTAPKYHAVYLKRDDPAQALVITRFDSKAHADAFAGTGLLDGFHQRILSCVVDSTKAEGFDLYYAAGPDGPRVVFGEDA